MFEIRITDLHLKSHDEILKIADGILAFAKEETSKPIGFHASAVNEEPELDASGAPWDEKIHSANKTKTTDGLWRTRRNSSSQTDEMEIELPLPVTAFTEFVKVITGHRSSGKLPTSELNVILKDFGVESVPELQGKQDLIPNIILRIKEFLADER